MYKEFLEIVWQFETNGQCVKGNNCSFRHDMNMRGEKFTIKSVFRILSCGRMSENHRGPEVPEVKVPVVERLDGLARITSEELAITHFVKDGTLQNASTTRPRVVVGLGRSAHSHTVRLMNSRRKGLKRIMTKVQWAMLKKGNWQERESVTDGCHDRPGKPGKRGDKKLGQNSSKRRFSDARQLGCVFQDMTPPKSILRKGTDMPKPIQRVKFTKAIARSYQNSRPKSLARLHLSRCTS